MQGGNASLSIHLPPILTSPTPTPSAHFSKTPQTFCTKFASRAPRQEVQQGPWEDGGAFLPNFKKLIDDAQAPRMSLQKFSSQKSGWRERERIFSGSEKKLRRIDRRG